MERSPNPQNPRLIAYLVGRVVEDVTRANRSLLDLDTLCAQAHTAILDLLALSPTVTDFLVELAARDVRRWLAAGRSVGPLHALAAD